jgi:predicted dehydrogenase
MFSVPHAFDDPLALVKHPEVDVVAITVKVPNHHKLAMAALAAGKHIYCEWPLGNGLTEAQEMAEAARKQGVCTAIGLQGRCSPTIVQVRDMIADGYIGRAIASSMVVTAEHLNDVLPQELETLLYPEHGTTMYSIHFGHLSDLLCSVLGEFRQLSAEFSTQRTAVTIAEDGRKVQGRAPDHIALAGILESGASASLHLRGGHSRGFNALWEINGTEGDLIITGEFGNMHMVPLQLQGGRRNDKSAEKQTSSPMLDAGRNGTKEIAPIAIESKYSWVDKSITGPAFNVAQTYVLLARDILTGSQNCANFDDALVRHRLLDAAARSANEGRRQSYDGKKSTPPLQPNQETYEPT